MHRLNTAAPVSGVLKEPPQPKMVRIPYSSRLKPVVKKKAEVKKGDVIAESRTSKPYGEGYAHATICGEVFEVHKDYILIRSAPPPPPGEEEQETTPTIPDCDTVELSDLKILRDDELARTLLEFGIDTDRFDPSHTLVINGLNPEPGVTISEEVLHQFKHTLEVGLDLLQRAIGPGMVYLVVPEGKGYGLHGCTVVESKSHYPGVLDPLVVKQVMNAEFPADVDVVSVSDLWRVGRVGETGLPLLEALLTVNGEVWRVPTGIPVEELLEAAGVSYAAGDLVILDGPMRGEAIHDLSRGVPENCTGLTVIPAGSYPPPVDNPCVSCGECVLACPARIQPGLLSRYVEFKQFEETRRRHINACLECGMCAYVCPANRPMLQYLRLAKSELKAADEFVATCRLQD